MRVRGRAATVAAVVVAVACGAAPAGADRKPTRSEAAAIETVAIAACARPPGDCRFDGARISTRDERFGWARVVGEGISGALVKRKRDGVLRFRVIGIQGGGIGECAYWRKRAPRAVLRDLRVRGLVKSGAIRNCGKR